MTLMRLPADTVLIIIDVQGAIDDPRWGPRNNLEAEANIAARRESWTRSIAFIDSALMPDRKDVQARP